MTDAARSLIDRTDRNRAEIVRLPVPYAVVAAIVVGIVVAVVAAWWAGLIAASVAGAATWALVSRGDDRAVDAAIGGRAATEDEFPRYHNLMEGLAIGTGGVVPTLRVLDEPHPNLAVFGHPDRGTVVATTGLLEILDRVELEGVLAEAFARLRSHDAELGAAAARLVCGPLVKCGPATGAPGGAAGFMVDARARRLRKVLGDQREFLSDLAAVDITRYPPGLGAALEKFEERGTAVSGATWGTAHLWLADPLGDPAAGDAALARLHQLFGNEAPIDQRASLMAEL